MAVHLVEFDRLVEYNAGEAGITVEITVGLSDKQVSFNAKIDTGSSFCIFERMYAEELGLKIDGGLFQRVSTATGSFTTFGFRVGLTVAGLEFDSLVYFVEDANIRRNVLGRHGWLELVKIGLIDYEGKLYLRRY